MLSSSITVAAWPNTKFIRRLDDIVDLKQQSGKDIYLMGGARITASLIDTGMVDFQTALSANSAEKRKGKVILIS